jgi:hypothetical protein
VKNSHWRYAKMRKAMKGYVKDTWKIREDYVDTWKIHWMKDTVSSRWRIRGKTMKDKWRKIREQYVVCKCVNTWTIRELTWTGNDRRTICEQYVIRISANNTEGIPSNTWKIPREQYVNNTRTIRGFRLRTIHWTISNRWIREHTWRYAKDA